MSNNKQTRFSLRKGLSSDLPNHAPLGEPLFCLDTGELYVGMGEGTKPKPVTNKKITEKLDEVSSQLDTIENYSMILNIMNFQKYVIDNDWTEAFQKAFDYLASNYSSTDINLNTKLISKIEVPSGRIYKITKTIYIKSPVLIKGIGANGTTCIQSEWSGTNYFDMFEIRDTTHSARICFENIRFRNICPGKSAIYAPSSFTENGQVKVGFMVDGYISKCWFENFNNNNGCGIRGTIADYLIEGNVFEHCNPCIDVSIHDGQNRIVNNIFYQCYKGVLVTGFEDSNSWQTKDTIIANNNMNASPKDNVRGYFVKLDKYSLANITNNTINNSSDNQLLDIAIILNKCSDIIISGNNISGVVLKGIEVSNSKNIIISANSINYNTTINGVNAINLVSTHYSNVTNNNIFNFNNIENSQGILVHDSSNNIISNNIVKDVYYGIRTTGNSFDNNFVDNIVESYYKKYEIYNNNFIKNNKNNILTINDDYACSGVEPTTIICNNTSFKTINFNFKGEYNGIVYTVVTNNSGSIQIYDGINSVSHGTMGANKSCFVMWVESKWIVLSCTNNALS